MVDVLSLVLECRNPQDGGAALVLDDIDEVSFGRGPSRKLEAPDGPRGKVRWTVRDSRMSSTHARLRRTPEGWWLEDLGSANGIYVDGARSPGGLVPRGAIIRIGHSLFAWQQHEVTAPPPAWTDSAALGFADDLRVFGTLHMGLRERLGALRQAAVAGARIQMVGEVGTGKQAMARAVHKLSGVGGAFVVAEGAEMTAALLGERFEEAKGGTLFIRDVETLSDEACAVVHTGLSAGEVSVVSASRQPVDQRPKEGPLAELYDELSGFQLVVPPVRERKQDIGLLIASLLPEPGQRSLDSVGNAPSTFRMRPEVGMAMLQYDWPRNIREMMLCLTTCFGMAEDETIVLGDLPASIAEALGETAGRPSERPGSMHPVSLHPGARTSVPPAAAFAHPKPPKR